MSYPSISREVVPETLLRVARGRLEEAVESKIFEAPDAAWLEAEGACFVTLRMSGRLRGCIGSIRSYRSLGEDLAANTRAAALGDPRFEPVVSHELGEIEIEVSVLSPMELLDVGTEAELLEVLRPGVDGLVIEHGSHRATFLPAVWREIEDKAEFVRRLKQKAGLNDDFWSPELSVWRYTTASYRESDYRKSRPPR